MGVASWFNSLRAKIWAKTAEQEQYRESTESLPFEKWFCRGYEAALDWVLEQAKEIHTIEELKALHSKR